MDCLGSRTQRDAPAISGTMQAVLLAKRPTITGASRADTTISSPLSQHPSQGISDRIAVRNRIAKDISARKHLDHILPAQSQRRFWGSRHLRSRRRSARKRTGMPINCGRPTTNPSIKSRIRRDTSLANWLFHHGTTPSRDACGHEEIKPYRSWPRMPLQSATGDPPSAPKQHRRWAGLKCKRRPHRGPGKGRRRDGFQIRIIQHQRASFFRNDIQARPGNRPAR